MKKIMLIIPTLNGGGAEKTIANLSYILEKEYKVYTVVFSLEEQMYKCGGEIISLDIGKGKNFFDRIFKNLLRIYKIYKLKKELKIDISISFLDTPNLLNVLTRKKDKTIISIRTILSPREKNCFTKLVSKFIFSKSDSIITLSKEVEKDLLVNYYQKNEKIKTIYNICPIELIRNKSKEKLEENIFKENSFNCITSGRLITLKGQWHLIRILAEVRKEIPNIKLFILGKGELEEKLKTLVKDYSLEENVIFLGFKKNPYKYINKADLFLFSSLHEGLGNVLIETLAIGTPIISSNCIAGPREILLKDIKKDNKEKIIYGDYGILIPPFKNDNFDSKTPLNQQEEILKNLLIECYKDKNIYERYREISKERIKDFSEGKIGQKWIEVIEELLNK